MAFERRHPGRFHAGRAAADHGHPHGLPGRSDLELGFAAEGHVDGALDRVGDMVPTRQAAVIAADARPDVLGTPFFGLERPLRVGPERPAQPDEVALALHQDTFGQFGQVDGARRDHRDAHGLLGRLGAPHVVRKRHAHGADFVDGGVVDAARHVDGGHAPGFEALAEFDGLVDTVAVRLVVGAGKAADHREVVAHLGLDLLDDLHEQADAVLERPAVLVGALVGVGRQEVGDQVAVTGVDLHQVEAGLLGAPGCLAERFDDVPDLVDGHGDGDRTAHCRDLRPGHVRRGLRLLEDEALPPGMRYLDAGPGSLRFDGVAKQRQSRQMVHPRYPQLARRSPAVEVVHPGVLHDDHGHTALRHLFVVAEQAFGDGAVGIGQAGVLRSLDDAVLERDITDAPGLEQSGERVSHQFILPSVPAVSCEFRR